MSRISANYEISRSTGHCAATGSALVPGQPCMAALCEREHDEGFDRFDYSIEAWESGARPDRLFSYWKTTTPEPNAKHRVFVDDELLLNLFERLGDDERPQRVAFRFVLALVLMRKRLLRQVGRSGDGANERWLFQPKGVGKDAEQPPIEVINPHLSDDDVRAVSDQLGEILSGEIG